MKAKFLRVLALDDEDFHNDSDWVICGGFVIKIAELTIVATANEFMVWLGNNLLIKRGV